MWVDVVALLQGGGPVGSGQAVGHGARAAVGWVSQAGMPGDTGPVAPPALGPKFQTILSYVKWIALAAIILTFFAGISTYTAGRVVDHRHYGTMGTRLMIAAGAGSVLYAVGYGLITGMAG